LLAILTIFTAGPVYVSVFVAVHTSSWGVVAFGLAFGVAFLIGVWRYLLNYAYAVTLLANGDIRFRFLWRYQVTNAAQVRWIDLRSAEGGRVLVIHAGGPKVRMSSSPCHFELVRLIGGVNPEADLPLEISGSSDDEEDR
jgi:hypothetical protein